MSKHLPPQRWHRSSHPYQLIPLVLPKAQLLTHAQIAQKRAQLPGPGSSLNLVYVRTAMTIAVGDSSVHEIASNKGPDPPYAGPIEAIGNGFQDE